MESQEPFKIALGALYTCFALVRIHYRRTAPQSRNGARGTALLRWLIPYEVITLFGYLLLSDLLPWARLRLPSWLRWTGFALGVVALLLFVWTHDSLGTNFSVEPHVREGHTLVLTGPYRWVRHPMYVAFYVLHVATFLLTASWFIGLTWTAGLTLVIASRIRREEQMMIARFGQEYRTYMQRTGRFCPIRALVSQFRSVI